MSKKTIYLEDAINALHKEIVKRRISEDVNDDGVLEEFDTESILRRLQPAQPDGISLEWIDKHLEWLDNCDNDFAQLAKVGIKAMVEIWKKDKI